jgi:acyl-coenzyme A thioesterase PaaI-like protein
MIKKSTLLKYMSFWPPFLGAQIKIDNIAEDFSRVEVSMKLNMFNKNYVNTHFGGSLYSMTDPFFMLMLIERLGPGFIVWDKAASIHFKRPGKGRVHAIFELSDEKLKSLKEELETKDKIYPLFNVDVLNDDNEVICQVEKTLYIKKK